MLDIATTEMIIKKWNDNLSGETDRDEATKAVKNLYKSLGEDEPTVVFGRSPLETIMSAVKAEGRDILHKRTLSIRPPRKIDDFISCRSRLSPSHEYSWRRLIFKNRVIQQFDNAVSRSLIKKIDKTIYVRKTEIDDIGNRTYSAYCNTGELGETATILAAKILPGLERPAGLVDLWGFTYRYSNHDAIVLDATRMEGIEIDEIEAYALAETYLDFWWNVSFIIPFGGVAFVSDKPTKIVRDDGVLSYDHDRAVQYSDGWGVYALDGVNFEKKEWEKTVNQQWTLEELAKAELGADKSAVIIKYLKPDLLLEQVKAKRIHIGIKGTKLYEVKNFMGTGETQYCMRMKHPSLETEYIEWVDPKVGATKDADYCQAFAFGMTKEQYLAAVEA